MSKGQKVTMHIMMFAILLAMTHMQGCGPSSQDNRLKILGWEQKEDAVFVNLDLKAVNDSEIPMFFGVSDEDPRVLSLQLENGMEIEPDLSKTLELPRSCANIHYELPEIEVACQVAFKTTRGANPKQLFYRWAGAHFVEVGAQF
jgi:hypothetical protein